MQALASSDTRDDASPTILRPGHNCGTIARADRAAVLVDGAQYFATLRRVLKQARHSIMILGWDFDASIPLTPGGAEEEALGDFLRSLVEERPELEIRVLVWNLATLHGPGSALPLVFGADWHEHPRIQLHLDGRHPIYAAQHQKIVCVDSLAFVGGIDLTIERWDTVDHGSDDPRRTNPDGSPYCPVHDLQWMIDGAAARAVCAVAHGRWKLVTGETVPERAADEPAHDPWPEGVAPDFEQVDLAVAQTVPLYNGDRNTREIEALNLDALAEARDLVYIEAQYFAEPRVADLLAAQLRRSDGPEVVVIVSKAARGYVEKWVMGNNRDRLVRRMHDADHFGRLRVFCPVQQGPTPTRILVHSKLVIVDDRFMKIGSANLNRRSMGLDTECDIALEATTPDVERRIRHVRHRLVAEHLGRTAAEIDEAMGRHGSLVAVIDELNGNSRMLQELDCPKRGPRRLILGTRLLDPLRPLPLSSLFSRGR